MTSAVNRMKSTPRVQNSTFYGFARTLVHLVNRYYFHAKVFYEAPLPSKPFILAPTHRSYVDTPLVGSVLKEPVRYMAKAELWENPWLGRLVELLGGFPVDRNSTDRTSLNTALAILKSGDALVVFPEGERRVGDRVEHLHEGVAYLALKSKVPVVPVAFYGSGKVMPPGAKLPRPAVVRAIVGRQIDSVKYLSRTGSTSKTVSRGAIVELTAELERELQRLYDQAKAMK